MDEERKKDFYIADRETLKAFFKKGNLPTQDQFEQLIHSNFNKSDDRLDINDKEGLMVYPADEGKLISFFKGKDDKNHKYALSISSNGIFIKEIDEKSKNSSDENSKPNRAAFFIEEKTGNIGIGKNKPIEKLDVDGLIASKGRLGNVESKVPADGRWYNLFEDNLDDVNAFEIMAYARGKKGTGRYSLLHAIALSTYGKSRPKITKTCSYWGKSSNKIAIRWVSKTSRIEEAKANKENEEETADKNKLDSGPLFSHLLNWFKVTFFERKKLVYNLQIRTMSHYGRNKDPQKPDDIKLFYKISELWNPYIIERKKDANSTESTIDKAP